jgi:serum/glucocorticoid-regulated kinase 2
MLSVIGKGAYGKVLLVRKKDSGKLYAIKVLKKSDLVRRN